MERWIVVGDAVVIEQLSESAWAVYNADYWDSAVFGEIDLMVYNQIRHSSGPLSTAFLVDSLLSDLPSEQRQSLATYCAECLRQMETLGLIHVADAKHA